MRHVINENLEEHCICKYKFVNAIICITALLNYFCGETELNGN